jgi:hypothetical protein
VSAPNPTGQPAGAQPGAWNPGIQSQVPAELLPLCTVYRPEHVRNSLAQAIEVRDLTGLELADLMVFRPERLALHELLIRVTADFSVPDGSKIEDLGINLRRITSAILARRIAPRMPEIVAAYEATRERVARAVQAELDRLSQGTGAPPAMRQGAGGRLLGLFGAGRPAARPAQPAGSAEQRAIADWQALAQACADPVQAAAAAALARVVSALLVRHGRVWGGRELIASIATDLACNDAGSDAIGRCLEPYLLEAAREDGYALLPVQQRPVVMNTKGPSASGKSTIRPLQRRLAGEIGVRWSEFALISPDIWRKQLLDFGTLGSAYKYGGAFTADEVRIVDHKLDRYMARKAERGCMSHLLIDRFRFDSFAPDSKEAGSNLLTRFGQIVYLFFMIAPPASLVERAWQRGLEVGRYKAVDDTLAHAVHAYSGMSELVFTWMRRSDKDVHIEFLDNSVPLGEPPRTVAFGWTGVLNILDIKCLLDVERYRRVDVNASAPQRLYRDPALLAPQHNTALLRDCVAKVREVNFAEQQTGRIYLRVVSGRPVWADREALERAAGDPDTRAGLLAVAPAAFDRTESGAGAPQYLAARAGGQPIHTLGRWGAGAG